MATINQYFGVGRRKTSVARVILKEGKGNIIINGKKFLDYFKKEEFLSVIMHPLNLTSTIGTVDIHVAVKGGGISGQLGAIRLGIARALVQKDNSLSSILKKEKLLTRDSRMKERKKYGQRGARAKFQFSKR